MTTLPNLHANAAQRARTIAYVARNRYADGPIRAALLTIADHMDRAATHFDAVHPGAHEGLPTEATEELFLSEQVAVDCPATRFPAELGEYVLALLVGRALPMPAPLHPADPQRALRETEIRNRLVQLHDDTASQWARPEEWMRSVLTTWQKHMRLADEVRAHNARPCNQR
ncbi:hypothetical protein [Streptomyces sp. NPDC046976]|uniref:hypothetical protein n=1 Tax=Streptomyces sp. NPDC046976 TaxID=3155258 RepID=UPI0033F3AD4C